VVPQLQDALFDNGGAPPPHAIDREFQLAYLSEEEALELAIAHGEFEELSLWNDLAI
jgi:hypothetical protein